MNKKYDQSFERTEFKTEKQWTSGFASWDRLVAAAHPTSNNQLVLEVNGCVARCDSGSTGWRDNYVRKVLAYEIMPVISQKVETIYGETLDVE